MKNDMNNNKNKTDNIKQRLLVEYLISSTDTFALCKSIVKPEYFDPDLRKSVAFIHEYYDDYSATPSPAQINAETGLLLTTHAVTRDQIEYCSVQVEAFCKRRAMQTAILASPALMENDDYGQVDLMIKDALSVSLNRNLGLSYFDSVQERLDAAGKVPQRISTMWPQVDDLLGGGLARTELLMFSANSGGGKSITMANLAQNFLAQPKVPGQPKMMDVLYISLELSEGMIAQRFDTMYTGVSSMAWQQNVKEIVRTIDELSPHMGRLTIKRMPVGTNSNAIRAYLKEFELKNGYIPDMLIVDYLDIMGANEHVSADNVFEKDKRAAEQLRDIGFDYNMFIVTASQQNRGAVDAQILNHSHIAGGLSKVNTVDWWISIIMDASMKAAGEIGFAFLKTRSSDGVGTTIYLVWDNKTLRIKNPKRNDSKDNLHTPLAIRVAAKPQVRQTLTDLFDTDDIPN